MTETFVAFAVDALRRMDGRLEALHEFTPVRSSVRNAITALENIQTHDSLRRHYEQMLNQCNVLLVSYFSAAAGDLFRVAMTDAVKQGTRQWVLREDIKIGLRDIRDIGPELLERCGELVASHRDISFQDMQSIGRAFKEYFDHEPPRDRVANDIIVSQACRHVLVHSGGIVDRKMLGQVRNAQPRDS